MAIENFDNEYKYDGDQFDQKTKTKMKGFYDVEKLENWRYKMEHLLKRRQQMQKLKQADNDYFAKKSVDSDQELQYSRQSLEFFEVMDESKRQSDDIEFKFASNFEDLKEMSTMIALT